MGLLLILRRDLLILIMERLSDTVCIIQGICPAGWHIPSLNEWSTLLEYVGGISVAGGMLKDTSNIPVDFHWPVYVRCIKDPG